MNSTCIESAAVPPAPHCVSYIFYYLNYCFNIHKYRHLKLWDGMLD